MRTRYLGLVRSAGKAVIYCQMLPEEYLRLFGQAKHVDTRLFLGWVGQPGHRALYQGTVFGEPVPAEEDGRFDVYGQQAIDLAKRLGLHGRLRELAVIEAAQFACSTEGRKAGSGAIGQLKAAVAAYNEAQ